MTLESSQTADETRLRLIDLFAGCGGLTAGFVATRRYQPIAAVEHDMAAAATYAANFDEDHVFHGDIARWVDGDVPSADVVVGGPPCQGFSTLGSRRPDDPRNILWRKYVEVLDRSKPKAFLLENVPQFGKSDEFKLLLGENHDGKLRNYTLRQKVVRATDYGAAQLRRRLIVIGTRNDIDPIDIPEPTVEREDWRSVRDEIASLQGSVDPGNTALPESVTSFRGHLLPGKFKTSELNQARTYKQLTMDRMAAIPAEGDRRGLPAHLMAPCWVGRTAGMDVMARLVWDKPSVTIRTEFFKPEKGRYLHPVENRVISHREAARLQGFEDTFEWCGNRGDIARQIGNAVPVPLARALAAHIAAKLA